MSQQPPRSAAPGTSPDGAAPKPSFWRTLRVVGWGFLGVRKNSEYQRDLAQINPFHVIVAGLIGLVLLVLLLLAIVNWVVAEAGPAPDTVYAQKQAQAGAHSAPAATNKRAQE